jgi:hypothetical protein
MVMQIIESANAPLLFTPATGSLTQCRSPDDFPSERRRNIRASTERAERTITKRRDAKWRATRIMLQTRSISNSVTIDDVERTSLLRVIRTRADVLVAAK